MTNLVRSGIFYNKHKARHLLGFVLLCIAIGCDQDARVMELTGFTMGTTYMVKTVLHPGKNYPDPDLVQREIDSILTLVNDQMSTYITNSEISRFNRAPAHELVPVSDEFLEIMKLSFRINAITSGAFDITMKPLVDSWGFGAQTTTEGAWSVPDSHTVKDARRRTGMGNIHLLDGALEKSKDGVEIDLNAIAKGFGVDLVADLVYAWFDDYMVEIGGEIKCSGQNRNGKAWVIGIESPETGKDGKKIRMAISLRDMAMATSGDYRRYFIYNGKVYSHIIDPRTGYPADSNIASATVIAPTCAVADALATAFMVLSPDHIMEVTASLEGVETLLMVRNGEELSVRRSAGFPADQ